MIPQWGWRSVLVLGGTGPLVLIALLVLLLPESVRYMVARISRVERIRSVLHRIAATVPDATSFVMHEKAPATAAKSGIGMVLSGSYLVGSMMFVGGLFYGPGDLLRADQLDAAPVQGRGARPADRRADLGPVPTRRRRGGPLRPG